MKRTLVRVSKKEAAQLRKMGVKDGENGIYTTSAHHSSNYLCESYKNMEKLKIVRQIKE